MASFDFNLKGLALLQCLAFWVCFCEDLLIDCEGFQASEKI